MTIEKKIMEHAVKLCVKAKEDRLIYGNAYVELGERSIKIIDPKDIKSK